MKKECNLVLIHSTHKPRMFLHYTIENPNTVPLEGDTVTVAKKMFTQLDNDYFNQANERFNTAIAMPLFDAPKQNIVQTKLY